MLAPKPTPKAAPIPKKSDILSQIVPASTVGVTEDYLIKAALLGHTGSGKTQAIITLPLLFNNEGNPKPILFIDYDGRGETLAGEPNIHWLKLFDSDPTSPKAWNDAEDLRQQLWALAREGDFPYSAVAEDSLTMMGQIAMNFALTTDSKRGLGGSPAKQHYNPQIHSLRKHINSMRMLPCHYLITGHYEMLQDESDGSLKILPKVTRSLRTEFPSWFNETYHCYREAGKDGVVNYFWRTAGTGKYEFFKSTLNNKQKFWKDPIQIDLDKPVAGFSELMQTRFKKEEEVSQAIHGMDSIS